MADGSQLPVGAKKLQPSLDEVGPMNTKDILMSSATLSGRQSPTNRRVRGSTRKAVPRTQIPSVKKGRNPPGRRPALTPGQAAELATLRALSKLVRKHCSLQALTRRYDISMTSIRTYALGNHVTFKPDIGTIAAALEIHFLSKGTRPRLLAIARAHNA